VDQSDWNQIGDGSIQTTVEDLARWDENFYSAQVGDARLLEAMQTPGTLNSGKHHEYGLGLFVGTYRGLKRLYHAGSWAGYRASVMRFPDQRTSIIVLCNVSNAAPESLAERVAAVWLSDAGLQQPSAPTSPSTARTSDAAAPSLSDADLRSFAGRYTAPDLTMPWTIEAVNHELRVRIRKAAGEALKPSGVDRFSLDGFRIEFERDAGTKAVKALTITSRGVEKLRLVKVSRAS
jgi:hypothetical protein